MVTAQTPWVLPGNTAINPATDYLGTQNNADLILRTNTVKRFRLLPDATYTIGSYASQTRDGALLLSPDVNGFIGGGAPGPFSMLHLAGVGVNYQTQTFRPWMRTGVTFTGNSDHGYIGQKCKLDANGDEISDETDMVAHWSGDPGGEYGPDRFRHIFTGGYIPLVTSGCTAPKAWKPCA